MHIGKTAKMHKGLAVLPFPLNMCLYLLSHTLPMVPLSTAVCTENTYVAQSSVCLSQERTGEWVCGGGVRMGGITCPVRALMTQGEKGKPKMVRIDGVTSDSTQIRELERSRR